nr:TIGR03118 family protein [uncultured Flavobacterium sp.]
MENKPSKSDLNASINSKNRIYAALITFISFLAFSGCENYESNMDSEINTNGTEKKFKTSTNYTQVNLVSDVEGYNAQMIDANLVNAWGIAFSTGGGVWISAAETGVSTIYDQNGNILRAPVTVPFGTGLGNPTGQVFNSTTSFVIPSNGRVSRFIFVTENGTVAAWSNGNTAITVADRSAEGAVYKGVELVDNNGAWFLYATDFHNGKVDMFDQNFNFVGNNMFADATIPAGFAPFNIKKIGNKLFVTYAKQLAPDNEDDEAGAGNGYVNIFDTGGQLIHRFASEGTLNSPWGIELMKYTIGFELTPDSPPSQETILIGNFGDGRINAYDGKGKFIGQFQKNGSPLEIEGLWQISYPPQENTAYEASRNRLYFTAGPDDEEHGLFGYIMASKK